MNDLPNERWLHDVAIRWRKAPRPTVGEIHRLLEERIDVYGDVEWREPYFYIKLIGIPKFFHLDAGVFESNPYGSRDQEIYVLLEDRAIIVKSASQDAITLAIADVLSKMFYRLQMFEDERLGKGSGAATS